MKLHASQGAWEFLDEKHALLAEYDTARRKAEQRPVKTEHGNVAEAALRDWLERFLPRRYGVCRGFVLDRWNNFDGGPLLHRDVIIYDALNAPVLWADNNSDIAHARRNRAIPVRHVMAVLEVKARLNGTSATEARTKLTELNEFKGNLHPSFCSGFVFVEIDPAAETSKASMDNLMPSEPIVGLFGGVVLRGNDIPADFTAEVTLVASPTPSPNHVSKEIPLSNSKSQWNGSTSVEWAEPEAQAQRAIAVGPSGSTTLEQAGTAHHYLSLTWSRNGFASFAFNLLDRLEGRAAGRVWRQDAPMIPMGATRPTPGLKE